MNMNLIYRLQGDAALTSLFDIRPETVEVDRIAKFRRDGIARIQKFGLPNKKVEAWKYTDLRAALPTVFPMVADVGVSEARVADELGVLFGGVDSTRFTIVNGHFDRAYSDMTTLPLGVEAVPLAKALGEGHPLTEDMMAVSYGKTDILAALNNAFMTDGVMIRVAAGMTLDVPLHIRFLNIGDSPFSSISRVVVVVEAGASVTILESHESASAFSHQENTMVEIVAGPQARVRHVRLADGKGATVSLSTLTAALGTASTFETVNVAANAALARHQIYVEFKGEHASVAINGTSMLSGKQHSDVTLMVDHAVPNCVSRELFKTIVDGEATGVFQGKIAVRKDAQKTDGKMMSASLLLSDNATMNNKPELEIFADDVVCGHGATCGQLDDELLFYLMSRGLSRPAAESLMVEAFLGDALDIVEDDSIKEALRAFISSWLAGREQAMALGVGR